jgi:hypothetical protein
MDMFMHRLSPFLAVILPEERARRNGQNMVIGLVIVDQLTGHFLPFVPH